MSLRQGPQIGAVDHKAATDAGFVLPDTTKPAPAAVAIPELDHVIPEGKFSGRTAAEARAYALERKEKLGVSLFAVSIKGAWCVVRKHGRNPVEYVEG